MFTLIRYPIKKHSWNMFMLIRYPRKNTPETCYFWSDIKQKPVKRDHLWPACKCALKLLKSMAGFRNDPVKAWSSHFDSRIMILMKNLRPFLVSFVASCPKAPDELNTSKDVITCIRERGVRSLSKLAEMIVPLVWTFVIIVTAGDELILGAEREEKKE